jgi:hypothetical protein
MGGAEADSFLGSWVAAAGDVNGDHVTDWLVSAPRETHIYEARVYVVFGGTRPRRIDPARLGSAGFVIKGVDNVFYGEAAATGAGDVNGDGLDDIVVADPDADHNGRANSGSAHVVFGKVDTAAVNLDTFHAGTSGAAGYRIDGPAAGGLLSYGLDSVGDANGDGLSDLVLGAPQIGAAYVVYGKADTAPQDLSDLDWRTDMRLASPDGYRIDHPSSPTPNGYALSAAGDLNADGRPDIAVASRESIKKPGRVWAVFGPRPSAGGVLDPPVHVDVEADDFAGFEITGAKFTDDVGVDIAPAGDFNGDGRSDLVVSAPGLQPYDSGVDKDSHVYVIYGKRTRGTVKVRDLGTRGTHVFSARPGMWRVAGVGDVNGDGFSDVAAGNGDTRNHAGAVYVVYGCGCSRSFLRAGDLGRRGVMIVGRQDRVVNERYGDSLNAVAGVGDQDGDGRDDLLLGAPLATAHRVETAGKAYLVPGRALRR